MVKQALSNDVPRPCGLQDGVHHESEDEDDPVAGAAAAAAAANAATAALTGAAATAAAANAAAAAANTNVAAARRSIAHDSDEEDVDVRASGERYVGAADDTHGSSRAAMCN